MGNGSSPKLLGGGWWELKQLKVAELAVVLHQLVELQVLLQLVELQVVLQNLVGLAVVELAVVLQLVELQVVLENLVGLALVGLAVVELAVVMQQLVELQVLLENLKRCLASSMGSRWKMKMK